MAWYHSLFERATDKELTEAVADSYLPDFQARLLRAIDDERQRRQDDKSPRGQELPRTGNPYPRTPPRNDLSRQTTYKA